MRNLILIAVLALAGCQAKVSINQDDAERGKQIVCYSGGEVIFQDEALGRVEIPASGAAYQFTSRLSGKKYRVPSAICIVGDPE